MVELLYVCDGKVGLLRYEAEYTDKNTGRLTKQKFRLQRHARKAVETGGVDGQGEVRELDVGDVAWMDGIEAGSYDRAVAIYEMGREAYEAAQTEAAAKSPEQMRADIDFLAAMGGVAL